MCEACYPASGGKKFEKHPSWYCKGPRRFIRKDALSIQEQPNPRQLLITSFYRAKIKHTSSTARKSSNLGSSSNRLKLIFPEFGSPFCHGRLSHSAKWTKETKHICLESTPPCSTQQELSNWRKDIIGHHGGNPCSFHFHHGFPCSSGYWQGDGLWFSTNGAPYRGSTLWNWRVFSWEAKNKNCRSPMENEELMFKSSV